MYCPTAPRLDMTLTSTSEIVWPPDLWLHYSEQLEDTVAWIFKDKWLNRGAMEHIHKGILFSHREHGRMAYVRV